jgi:hypothetical protein
MEVHMAAETLDHIRELDSTPNTPRDESRTDDLSNGQIVTIIARWLLIATGLVITLWSPAPHDLTQVKISLFVLLGLAVGNFFLHAQLLMKRPMPSSLVYCASALDLAVVTLITAIFGGLAAPMFVFYYPALLALGLAFPRAVAITFTLATLGAYAMAAVPYRATDADLQIFIARLISLVAVAVIAQLYQHVEHDRREHEATHLEDFGTEG